MGSCSSLRACPGDGLGLFFIVGKHPPAIYEDEASKVSLRNNIFHRFLWQASKWLGQSQRVSATFANNKLLAVGASGLGFTCDVSRLALARTPSHPL